MSGQQATFGGGAQDTSYGDTSYGSTSYGSTDYGGYGSARQDDAYGGSPDATYGSGQNGTQDGSYGTARDSAYGGQDVTYGSDSPYGSDRGPFAGTDGVSDRDLTPEQDWQRRSDPAGTTAYSARMLAEPTGVTDPVSEPTGAATGAYGYTPPPPTPAAAATSRRGKARGRTAVAQSAGHSSAQPRRANLVIARLEPWSVMKFSFLISLVAWIVLFVAVGILYYALSGLGVFDALQKTLTSVTSSQGSAGVSLSKWTSASRVLGYTMLIGAVNVVLITALSTVGAMIYNLVTHLGGGIEVTLKETD